MVKRQGRRQETTRVQEGDLVAVLQDDRHKRIYWFQASGVVRKVEGVQVFLDPRRRTMVTVGGRELAAGPHKVPGEY